MRTVQEKIRLKQMELSIEGDPLKKQKLQLQLQKLHLQNEIETILRKIERLG